MARSEARVLVSLPRHLQKYWYDIPMEPCLWEEKCFPVNQLIYYSNIAGWKVPAKPFRAIFCFERIPGGFEHGTVQILATSIQGEGQFCFFPTSHWTAVFWRTRWMRPFFLKFSFRLRSVLTSVCFFFLSWWLLFLYLLLTEKKQHIEKLSNFSSLCWTHFEGFPPQQKPSPNPHTGFWVDLQLPGAAAKKHLELKSAKAEEIRSWERKWREAGPDVLKLGTHGWAGKRFQDVFFLERSS